MSYHGNMNGYHPGVTSSLFLLTWFCLEDVKLAWFGNQSKGKQKRGGQIMLWIFINLLIYEKVYWTHLRVLTDVEGELLLPFYTIEQLNLLGCCNCKWLAQLNFFFFLIPFFWTENGRCCWPKKILGFIIVVFITDWAIVHISVLNNTSPSSDPDIPQGPFYFCTSSWVCLGH